MFSSLPPFISVVFILTTLSTLSLYCTASPRRLFVLGVLGLWLLVQGVLGFQGFYTVTSGMPPRFLSLIGIPLIGILCLFLTAGGRRYLDRLDPKVLTYLHLVRVPVELVLWWLFLHAKVPELMTFEGRNFDILAGITAPFVAFFGYTRQQLGKTTLMLWNVLGLMLLFNIVINAVLSIPFDFQQQAFEQPNVAVLYFPFVWLPGCVVPLVLLSHLATLRFLLKKTKDV